MWRKHGNANSEKNNDKSKNRRQTGEIDEREKGRRQIRCEKNSGDCGISVQSQDNR